MALLAEGHATVFILGLPAVSFMPASAKKGTVQSECPRGVGFLRKTAAISFGCKERKC